MLFNLSDPTSKIDQTKILVEEIKSLSINTNQTSSVQEIVTNANLIDSFVKIENIQSVNIPKSFNTTITVQSDGKLSQLTEICDDENFCSKRGKCSYSDTFKRSAICLCDKGFSGPHCEMTTENKEIVRSFTVNAISSIEKSLNSENIVIDPNTGASTKQQKEITPSIIKAVELQIKNGVSAIDTVEDANKFQNVVKLILGNNNDLSIENVVNSSDDILKMISHMYSFSKQQIKVAKTNANRLKNNNRILSFDEDIKRNLQDTNQAQLTPQDIYKRKVDLILNLENSRKLIENLASKFAQHFNNKFSKILNSTVNDSLSVLESQNITEFIENNDNIHFTMMFTPIINIDTFNFVKYFKDRVDNNLSYIDPQKCLKTFVNSFMFKNNKRTENSVLNQVVFALYVFDKSPMFTISDELMKHATSNSHSLHLFDIKGNHFELKDCMDEIFHFIPLNPYDPTFIQRFNANPKKYELSQNSNVTSINLITKNNFMPIYIAPDGTIEKDLTIQQQIDKYYPVYKFYLSVYNVKNVTLYNTTINFDKIFENLGEDSVKYIKNSQFVASSRSLDNMAIMNFYDPPKELNDRYYFLKNDNVLRRSSNWAGNWCFITLTILFCINFIFLILILIFGCLTPQFIKKNNDVYKTEMIKYETQKNTAKIDDLIFDQDLNNKRNNMYYYLYQNEEVAKVKKQNEKGAAYEEENQQGIELQNVKIEMADNQNVNSEAGLKSNISKQKTEIQVPKTNSLVHFIFKRNIYTNLFNLTSPFDPAWKFFTKLITLVYLLLFFCTCMFIYSGIDFNPTEVVSSWAIAQSVFISIGISNLIFTLINLFYSSMINSNRISNIIKTDFNGDSM